MAGMGARGADGGSLRGAIVLAVLAGAGLTRPGHCQELYWTRTLGTDGAVGGIELSPAGGVFVVGYTPTSLGGPSAGGLDVWLAHYDINGHQAWIRQFGGPFSDDGMAIAPDAAGGVFIGGHAGSDLGGGPGGSWVARYTGTGERVWIRQLGASEGSASALAPDGAGGFFAAGRYQGEQRWVARYDADGNRSWIEILNDTYRPLSLAVDGVGGVFQGAGIFGVSSAVSRHNGNGAPLWMDAFGSPVGMRNYGPWAVVPSDNGGITAIGWADYHPALGTSTWFARYTGAGVQAQLIEDITSVTFAAEDLGGGQVLLAGAGLGRFNLDGQMVWTDSSWNRLGRALTAASPESFFVASSTTWPGGSFALHYYGPCYANCDNSITQPPILNVGDFTCFLQRFAMGQLYANCDQSTTPPVLNVADFTCFLQRFAAGCP